MENPLEEVRLKGARGKRVRSGITRRRKPAHYDIAGALSRVKGGRRLVRNKFRKLQGLIPGGQGLQPDRLFLRTADYILHLRLQVNVLQALSKLYKPCDP
ncbi:hypothetical protein ACLOJK_030999 [Asimina triloba]